MDWTIPLRSQQADFIERLKSGHLLHCEKEGQHSELTVISGERLKQLRNFCWEMAEKYKRTSPVRDVFINNLKGKLGEEVVKARLGNFVTEVDYEKKLGGDGKVDFTLSSDSSVGIQVKARHGNIDTLRWSISAEEVEKNAVLVCILIQEEVNEAQAEYHLVLAGFLPKMLINNSGKKSFKINELLYGGGLQSYLKNLALLDNNSKAKDYFTLGLYLYKEKKYHRSIRSYTEAIRIDPLFANAYYNRGISRSARGDKQGAIEDYTAALRINPKFAKGYYSRGNSYSAKGDKQSAIEDYTEALKIDPNYAQAYLKRGDLLIGIEKKLSALEDFKKAALLYKQQGKQTDYQKAYDRILKICQEL